MSNKKQSAATQGLTMEDHVCIISLLQCAKRGETLGKQSPPSIREVPRILRELNESSFIPQLVSIGPIHREDPKLKEFEGLKEHYLDDLLNRCRDSTPRETLEACLRKDHGCFILEFCFKHAENENMYLQMQNIRIAMDLMLLENQVPFSVLQALFNCSMGKESFTLSDVLDEYLAPYFKLFGSPFPDNNSILSNVLDKYLAPYIKLFGSLLPEKISTTDVASDVSSVVDSGSTHDHVLGFLHKHYQPVGAKSSNPIHADVEASKPVDEEQAAKSSNPIHADVEASKPVDEEQAAKSSNPIHADVEASKPVDEKRIVSIVYHSTVALDRSGMKFKPHQEDNWSMTIKFKSPRFPCLPWFWSNGALLMPPLVIDDFTELILRNFIAYEQSVHQDRCYFTSYAHAMDMLIDTQEDVAILAESKVLVNQLCSNREAADMINKIGKTISVTDFLYTKEFEQMDKYYNAFWPKKKRTYFSNPWNVINLIGGIIVSFATVAATFFAILDYYR